MYTWSLYRSVSATCSTSRRRTIDHLGLEASELVQEDRTVTHQLGEVAHQFGYQAVRNASAAGVDDVIAVFIENLRSGVLSPSESEAVWNDVDDIPVF